MVPSLLVILAIAVGGIAGPTNSTEKIGLLTARGGAPTTLDLVNYFYSWTPDGTPAPYKDLGGGSYSVTWPSNVGIFIVGKGWNPGTSNRVINYSGTYTPSGNGHLSVYGWTRNPLIEYIIVESFGTYNPAAGAQRKGIVTCNGASYDILSTWRYNQPSIDGTQTFQQFWSVRNPRKNPVGSINGTVDIGCHFEAWQSLGMILGTNPSFQIVAITGYYSSGSATITVA